MADRALPAGEILLGDCKEVMAGWPDASVDTFICDPPYGLEFMGKEWDRLQAQGPTKAWRRRVKDKSDDPDKDWGVFNRTSARSPHLYVAGHEMQEWHRQWAAAALRVAKPGAFLLAFGGTRTFHRLACALEDAGWEIRDTIMWLYGSGFPKSLDISKAIDADACRDDLEAKLGRPPTRAEFKAAWKEWREVVGTVKRWGANASGGRGNQLGNGYQPSEIGAEKFDPVTAPATPDAKIWNGWGTALKPAWEPIIVAMKPCDGTFADNALTHGVAGLNIAGSRIKTSETLSVGSNRHENGVVNFGMKDNREGQDVSMKGRWPANVILDEQAGALLDSQSGSAGGGFATKGESKDDHVFGYGNDRGDGARGFGDSGGASRFFYCAKADRKERELGLDGKAKEFAQSNGGKAKVERGDPGYASEQIGLNKTKVVHNDHPTVKPIALMRYLCRLTKTPAGGVVVDPFAGSGSTCIAARLEGRPFIGIEIDAHYRDIAIARLAVVPDSLFAEVKK